MLILKIAIIYDCDKLFRLFVMIHWISINESFRRIFVVHQQENIILKVLNLAWNGFGNDGALAMGEALKVNSSLLELNLS